MDNVPERAEGAAWVAGKLAGTVASSSLMGLISLSVREMVLLKERAMEL